MSTALPLRSQDPVQDPSRYRDRKKAMWLLSVIAPAYVVIGPAAYLMGHPHPMWFFAGLLTFYVGIPLLDAILGEDLSNPPEGAVPRLEADRYYRWINYAVVQSPSVNPDKAKRWNKMVPLLQGCIDKGLFPEAYIRISILVAAP